MVFLAGPAYEGLLHKRLLQCPNPYNIRIQSLYYAYNKTGLCTFWVQQDAEKPTAFIVKSGMSLVLDLLPSSDLEEIRAFIKMVGFSSLLYDAAFHLPDMPLAEKKAFVMRLEDGCLFNLDRTPPLVFTDPHLKTVHLLFKACKNAGFSPPPFESFYLEMSHRLRHNCAKAVGIEKRGILLACALAVFKNPYGAVLGGVATHPQYRGLGLGRAAVTYLCAGLQKEKINEIYLHTAQKQTVLFYERLGFAVCGLSCEETV